MLCVCSVETITCVCCVNAPTSITWHTYPLFTAPCDPENVTVDLQCALGALSVEWEASAGALGYTVVAHSQGTAYVPSCRTNGTSCELSELPCGKVFNVTVLAGHKTCNSSARASTSVQTGTEI